MSESLKTTGIILSARPVGENDKSLTILTGEYGKMQVFARGSRKVKNSLHGASQALVYGEFLIAQSRLYNYLSAADIRDFFPYVKDDLEKITYSTYFAELAEHFCVEGQGATDILNLIYVTFQAMRSGQVPLPLIRRIYELKLLQLSGFGMQTDACLHCGRQEETMHIAIHDGGVICDKCAKTIPAIPVSGAVLKALRYISGTPLQRLFSFRLEENILEEFTKIVNQYFRQYASGHFRSEEMLDLL